MAARTSTRVCAPAVAGGAPLTPSDLAAHPTARALATAQALPGTPLGGWAAAHLLGVADMDGCSAAGDRLPVLVCPGRSGRVRPRDGIHLLRSPLADHDVVRLGGGGGDSAVLVTSPVRTAFDLARTAPDLWRAVEEVDCAFRGRDPAFLALLGDYAAGRPRWKGVARAKAAVALASVRSLSRGESWLRLVWCSAGLPPPLVNSPVRDGEGRLLAVPDLLDPVSGLAAEYDGATHRTPAQQHADAVRGELMAGAGLTVVRASALDRRAPRALVRRLLAGHDRARGSERRPGRPP